MRQKERQRAGGLLSFVLELAAGGVIRKTKKPAAPSQKPKKEEAAVPPGGQEGKEKVPMRGDSTERRRTGPAGIGGFDQILIYHKPKGLSSEF